MKFTIIKSCLARFSGIFAVGTPSNIHGTAISYRCAKFGTFVNSVTILTLRDLTIKGEQGWHPHSPPTNVAGEQTRRRRVISGLKFLLVLSFAPRGFSLGALVFPSPRKPSFLNSHEVKFRNTSCSEFVQIYNFLIGCLDKWQFRCVFIHHY